MPEKIISDELCRIFQWAVVVVVSGILGVSGIVTNTINSVCFIKQGLKDSVNINFIALAISDIGCQTTQLLLSLGFTPSVQDLDLPVVIIDLVYLAAGWPHVMFSRATSWITASMTIERCLCITMPLQVKSFFTPKRTVLTLVIIYIIDVSSVVPVYYANRLGWKVSKNDNRTILGLIFTADRADVDKTSSTLNNLVIPVTAFLLVSVFTVVLVISLRNQSKWREKSATAGTKSHIKVARMVVVIAVCFIICNFPLCLAILVMMFLPELSVDGEEVQLSILFGGIGYVLESLSSVMNIFIYYRMSSRYKLAFHQLFKAHTSDTHEIRLSK